MRKFILKYIDILVFFIHKRIKVVSALDGKQTKENIKNSLLNKGYGLCLNGTHWVFSQPKKIILGNNVHIGNNAFFKSEGGIIIGDNTHFSRNVTIFTINHDYNGTALPYDKKSDYKPVEIGKNVWIGMNVTITPGVKIGDGAIIGIGTVVNRTIEALEIVGSPKTKHLKFRDEQHYSKLLNTQKFGGINGEVLNDITLSQFGSSYQSNKDKDIVFILGTGRSGTKSLTDVFNQNPKCKALHENISHLIRISTLYAYSQDDVHLEEIERIFSHKIFEAEEAQTLILSDQRFWNLVPFLSTYFKNAKFIHVVRQPLDCVLSMVSRNWYKENEYPNIVTHDWAKYRLNGFKVGFYESDQWDALSVVEKSAWYYAFVNKTISTDLKKIQPHRCLTVELEKLDDRIDVIADFVGQKDFKFKPLVKNMSRPEYAKNKMCIDKIAAAKEIETIINQVDKSVKKVN